MKDPVSLRAMKSEARREFGKTEGVLGFGLRECLLRVYVRDSGVEDRLR